MKEIKNANILIEEKGNEREKERERRRKWRRRKENEEEERICDTQKYSGKMSENNSGYAQGLGSSHLYHPAFALSYIYWYCDYAFFLLKYFRLLSFT